MAEIALGRWFGNRMVEDHQKGKQEVTQLASRAGVELPAACPHAQAEHQHSPSSRQRYSTAPISKICFVTI